MCYPSLAVTAARSTAHAASLSLHAFWDELIGPLQSHGEMPWEGEEIPLFFLFISACEPKLTEARNTLLKGFKTSNLELGPTSPIT